MAKHLSLLSAWVVVFVMALGLRAAGRMHADPTDDFSFSLAHAPGLEVYRLMPEKRVTEILQDRLDLFPISEAPKLARHLLSLCKQYRFDPAFILSLIQVESDFKIKVVSPNGAVGLMQIMPATAVVTAHEMGIDLIKNQRLRRGAHSELEVANRILRDPYVNLTFGVAYLSWLRDHYHGLSSYYLVAAYNIGPARLDELRTRKSFKPVGTKRYFDAIKRGVPQLRFYRRDA